MNKIKRSKFFAISSLLGISIVGLFLVSTINLNNNKNNLDNSLVNKNTNLTRNKVNPQPLTNINDLKITSQNIESGKVNTDEVVDNNGNYILTATNQSSNKAKIVKLDFQMQYLYQWEYNVLNYQTRQIVADTDDNGYLYVLLVNNQLTLSVEDQNNLTANDIRFIIQNPAIVVQIYDTGSSFEQLNVYNLGLPNFGINNKANITSNLADTSNTITDPEAADNIWDHIYVQEAIQETDDNSKLSFIRNTTTSNSTASDTRTTENNIYVNDDSKSIIYKLLGNSGKKAANSAIDTSNHDYYILKQLYLNNANNMVYLKDKYTNKKMILLFGGNAYQSFWFYNFEVKTTGKQNLYVTPLLYANYDFDPYASKYQNEVEYYANSGRNNSSVLKKYFYLPFMLKNKISNLAWFVGGAKTLTITNQENNKSDSYVFLAMMQPNISDFNSSLVDNAQNIQSANIETIKKGTFGTPEEVSSWNESNKTITGNYEPSSIPSIAMPAPQNTNIQNTKNTGNQYNNQDILVSSSSINASLYQLGQSQGIWSTRSDNFKYPFSAIQTQTILPIMTSEIASSICIEPKSSYNDFPEEKIYLNTFSNLSTNSNSNFPEKFSLFNCVETKPSTKNFKRFDFAREIISNPRNWTQDIKNISAPPSDYNGTTTNNPNQIIEVGYDFVGLSRILLNKNPKKSSNFLNDGWENTASQKIVAFSPQLTSKKIKTSFGTYMQVGAVLIFRGFAYSFTYDYIQPALGLKMVPYANLLNDKTKNSIELINEKSINKFTNLLSISYFADNWVLTYQDKNLNKHLCYRITYLSDLSVWSFSLDNYLSSNGLNKISKLFVFFENNFIFLYEEKTSQILNTNTNSTHNLDENSSITTNSNIWGIIKPVEKQHLIDSNLLDKTPSEIVSDYDLLKQLINYSGGWSVIDNQTNKPTEEPIIFNIKTTSSTITFDVALKFINGKYYTSVLFNSLEYPNIVYNTSLNIPSFSYDGFASLAVWVMPAIISGVSFLVVLFILIGVLVTLSLHKNKKIMQKGFASSNKKIDTLTTAVGSVYQKILTQTKNNKSPQMLKAARKRPTAKSHFSPKSPNSPKSTAN
ncbi:hypothetical protein [Mycoplasmoides pirum]|uniref:hypothetical protein n=1 Tax=Mycoplasmoides pirum TaxID=2122 RepID=UPI00047FCA87|nr:hypothetical protein [Mycoplasmoides pirum]